MMSTFTCRASDAAARNAAPPDSAVRPCAGEQTSQHRVAADVVDDGEHPQHGHRRADEAIERGVDDVSHGARGAAHDALHVGDGAGEVAAVDRRRAAEPDHDVLGEVGHADHLVGDHLTDRHDRIPPGEQLAVDGDLDRLGEATAGHHLDLVGADLAEVLEAVPPIVDEEVAGAETSTEQQLGIVVVHRRVRAQRREHGHIAPGGAQLVTEQHGDHAGSRVQPGVVRWDEQHAPTEPGDGRRQGHHMGGEVRRGNVTVERPVGNDRRRREPGRHRTNSGQDLVDHDVDRAGGVDEQDVELVRRRPFQGRELTRHHLRPHEVAASTCRALARRALVEIEEGEPHAGSLAQHLAVATLEGRARHDDGRIGPQNLAHPGQPRPSIVVGQLLPGRHLGHVGGGMEVIGVDESSPESRREPSPDHALA